jgi:cation/acetate symporter
MMGWLRRLSLHGKVSLYALVLLTIVIGLILSERSGLRREYVAMSLLGLTVLIYAFISIACRTAEPLQYYAAGRSVPALYNGMATAADWMSAASFISLVGALYASGYSATVFLLGWTGGFCLVALLVAPYLRQIAELTLPDFFARRYGGYTVRLLATLSVLCCSFIYVVAQIYAVGLISSRILGLDFVLGIVLGLGTVLLCSFLGGMKAITWTQVAQYIVMLVAVLLPLGWLAVKQTGDFSSPFNYKAQLEQVIAKEQALLRDPAERDVIQAYQRQLADLDGKLAESAVAIKKERDQLQANLISLRSSNAATSQLVAVERQIKWLSGDPKNIIDKWQKQRQELVQRILWAQGAGLAALDPPIQGAQSASSEIAPPTPDRINFIALILILGLGTASMPHLLMRFQTTSSVAQTRSSVSWALFFILLLYLCLPVLAVLIKLEILTNVVGLSVNELPQWLLQWSRSVPDLVQFIDINADGKLQWNELVLGGDVLMLALPEIAGMPYTITALVAAGGLAAALSTADGLLLSMTAVLSRDLLPWRENKSLLQQSAQTDLTARQRSLIGPKFTLLIVTLLAAYVAMQKPAGIVALVTLAFSMAASTFFIPIVCGIFWRKANRWGAIASMLCGAGVTLYLVRATPMGEPAQALWLGVQPVAAGIFGVFASAAAMLVVTVLTAGAQNGQSDAVDVMRDHVDRHRY